MCGHSKSTYNVISRCKYNSIKKFEFEFAFEFEFRGWIILSFCRATVYTFWELDRICMVGPTFERRLAMTPVVACSSETTVGDCRRQSAIEVQTRLKLVDRLLDSHCDFELWPHPSPWPLIFKVKLWKSRNSGMEGLIDMEWKGCESIGC